MHLLLAPFLRVRAQFRNHPFVMSQRALIAGAGSARWGSHKKKQTLVPSSNMGKVDCPSRKLKQQEAVNTGLNIMDFFFFFVFNSLCFYPSPQRRTSTSVYSLNTFDIKWKLLISAPSQMWSWLVLFSAVSVSKNCVLFVCLFLTPPPSLTSEEDNYGLLHFARYLVCFMKIPPATVQCSAVHSGQVSLYSALCVDKMDLIFISAGAECTQVSRVTYSLIMVWEICNHWAVAAIRQNEQVWWRLPSKDAGVTRSELWKSEPAENSVRQQTYQYVWGLPRGTIEC